MQKRWLIGILFLLLGIYARGQDLILDQPESLSFSNISVDSALRLIEIRSGLHFTFRSDLLQNKEKVNAEFENVPLCIILDSLFENPNLNYKIIEKQLVVYDQKKDSVSDSIETDSIAHSGQFTFAGEVQDADTREKLSFAAISLQNSTIGTISNEDGFFSLKLKNWNSNDTVLISYLGYETYKIPLSSISEFAVYPLKSVSISLQEVIVRGLFAENIVRLAIASKKKNYPDHSFVQRAFYRETVKHDRKYMLYSEGILDVLKRPYRPTLFNEQVKLEKQRSFKSIDRKDTIQLKLYGGIRSSLDLDVVKNNFPFIDEVMMSEYDYHMRDLVLNEGKLTYKIEFEPKNPKIPFVYKGCIYIDLESLAFVKLEFEYSKMALNKMRNTFVIRSSPKLLIIPQDARYTVTYKESEGFYYIHHIQGELILKVKYKRNLWSSKYSASFEMVATELNGTAPRRFSANQTINTNKIFSDLSPNYDLNFWGNENFLLPEEDLMKAFKRLSLEH